MSKQKEPAQQPCDEKELPPGDAAPDSGETPRVRVVIEKSQPKDAAPSEEGGRSEGAPGTAGPGGEQDPRELEIAELKRQNGELNDKLLRHYAEFDNYKKRTAKEKEELSGWAKGLCLKQLLDVLDNFERSLAAGCSDEEFQKGVEMIFHQFQDRLRGLGVVEIEAQGQPFDPELHNAVSQTEDENFGENTVSQVLQKGYMLDGKVLRHAMVVVANP